MPRDPTTFAVAVDIEVRRPPTLPAVAQSPLTTRLVPVLMVVAAAGVVVFYLRSGSAVTRNPMFVLFPVMMALSALGSVVLGSRGTRRTAERDADRCEYLRYLSAMDDCVDEYARRQFESAHDAHPAPEELWHSIGTEKMWQRCPGDPDYLHVRIGIGTVDRRDRLVCAAPDPDQSHDPVTSDALDRLLRAATGISGTPVTVPLTDRRTMTVGGAGAVRALVCQLITWHGPDHVRILTLATGTHWGWLKWSPHHHRTGRISDATLQFDDVSRLLEACDEMTGVHLIVIVDGYTADIPERADLTVIVCDAAASMPADCRPDTLTMAHALSCSRLMAKYDLAHGGSGTDPDWATLLGHGTLRSLTPETAWSCREQQNFLRVPVGVGVSGEAVHLDLKEAAAAGMGPHGLCIGATGSGKSEFLRTLTLGLVSTHSPTELNLVLVDFKGGATFLGFDKLRHVCAVITNLEQEAHLVSRMRDALAGELNRRQHLLRTAGNLAGIGDYRNLRAAGTPLDPLPALFIVVDEFSELLSQHPDFVELFVAIGRLGRSLGIHLLLASQRLDEGRLRGLETHLSYRICLKTFSASESRAVLGVPDAHQLPSVPGSGFLKTADGEITRFRSAFVSASVPDLGDDRPRLFTGRAIARPIATNRPTVLQAVVDTLSGHGRSAHQVWLPPLDGPPVLADLLTDDNRLCVPIGLVDNPFDQCREVLTLDLRAGGGHVGIVGGPRSGKSTTLKTLVLALAATHCASDVNVYGLDLGEGSLSTLRGLPHVGAVAGRGDPELVHRIISQLVSVVRRRQQGRGGSDGFGEVMLVIDGWSALRRDFGELEEDVTMMAVQGLSVGVHVVLTASRWADLRPALKDQIGSRIELRLGDPAESEMDRRRAQLLLNRPPGHGITRDGKEFAIARPHVDAVRTDACAPSIDVLPTSVPLETGGPDFAIGLGADDLQPFVLDLDAAPLLIVLGDNGCGKTATLRALCRSVMCASRAAKLLVVDFRRTLLGVVEGPQLAGYAMSPVTLEAELVAALDELSARLPGPGVSQQELRDRSWWSGPEIYVIVDDYDLVAGASGSPLAALADLLPHARDIGLHVVIARRSGGAARAMFDPVLTRMRDLGAMGLLMSADTDEGVLMGGVRSAPLPPGRGVLVQRGRAATIVQIGWCEPS